MSRDEFFAWAEAQEERYEFDGFEPVAMTGGNLGHSAIAVNIVSQLRRVGAVLRFQSYGFTQAYRLVTPCEEIGHREAHIPGSAGHPGGHAADLDRRCDEPVQ